jgi:serine/threonine protein phosphatase 1
VFSRLGLAKGAKSSGSPARGAPGKRCYVIGDVHGRLDLLTALLDQIAAHSATRGPRETILVLLGDLIDRGPDSQGVVTLARTWRMGEPAGAFAAAPRLVVLSGNHEDLLVRGLSGAPSLLPRWLGVGGDATARSYGVAVGDLFGRGPDEIALRLEQAIPLGDLNYLARLPTSARFGDYFLAHAGVRPGVAFEDQSPEDLRWIRKPFLESRADHGGVVVHGHSETAEVEDRPNRVGIDTGAYRTGVLTALWIEDGERGFLQATDGVPKDNPETSSEVGPTAPLV